MITILAFFVKNWILYLSIVFIVVPLLYSLFKRIYRLFKYPQITLNLKSSINSLFQKIVEKIKLLPPEKKWQITKGLGGAIVIIFLIINFGHFFLPPKILVSFPGDQGTEIPLDSKIEITFDRGMIKPFVEKNFQITPSILGKLNWEGDQKIIFTPDKNLSRGSQYKVNFSGLIVSKFLIPLIGKKDVTFEVIGQPKVILASPKEESLEDLSPVTVVFDRPMISLTTAKNSALKKPAFIITPNVSGEGRWLGTTTYQFRPDKPYKKATTYKVVVLKGLTSQDGGVLANDYSWEFSSQRPRIDQVLPQQDYRFASPVASISAFFNQEMEEKSFKDKFLVYDQKNNLVSGRIVADGKIVGFHPSYALERETFYQAIIKSGVRSIEGVNGMEDDYSWSFKVAAKPAVISSIPFNGQTKVKEEHEIKVNFKTPMDEQSFKDNVVIDPQPELKPFISFSSDNYLNTLYISTYLARSQQYTITIGSAVKDQDGFPLGQPHKINFTTVPYNPSVSISPGGTYFAAFNQEIIPRIVVCAINTNQINYNLYRLKKEDLLDLYQRRYQDKCGSDELCRNWQSYDPSKLEKVNSWKETYEAEKDTPVNVVTKVNLSNNEKIPPGFYFLEAKIAEGAHDNLVMIVSQSTLTVKKSNNQIFVWAVNQSTGEVIKDLKIQLTNSSGQILSEGKTNQDGIFQKQVDLLKQSYLFVFGEKNNDSVVASSSWNLGINSYDFGLPSYYNPGEWKDYEVREKYKLYTVTDRPIYRPNQKVYFKGVIRKDNDGAYENITPGEKVNVVIKDARQRTVFSKMLALNSFGAFSGEFSLSKKANLGYYELQSDFKGNNYTQQFQVEEYKKPDLAVLVNPSKEAYVNGETGKININATYYFGAPVTNAQVNWTLQTQDYYFHWEKDWRFEFGDPDDYWKRWWSYGDSDSTGEALTEGKGKTNNKGDLDISLPLNIDKEKSSQKMILEATVNDLNNQSIASSKEFTVHKAGLYVGLRPASYANQSGKEAKVEVVVVDLNGKEVANTLVNLDFYKRTWETVREKNPDDGLFYNTTKSTDSLVKSVSVTTDSLGRAIASFTPTEGGTYKVIGKVKDKTGSENISGSFLWVSGHGFSIAKENHDRIVLITDKRDYLVGEEAEVFVASPFTPVSVKTLLTAERGSVLSYEVVDTNDLSNNFKIKVLPKYTPNVFIGAVLVKPGSQVKNPPEFKVGYSEIKVTDKKQQLEVKITTDKKRYLPKETLKATIETKNRLGQPVPSELAVGLIDKAVWDLARVEQPEIYEAFYKPRNLEVNTSQLLTISMDRINANTNLGAKGGSGGCFLGETKILIRGGQETEIQKIKARDIILTKENENSANLVEAKVKKTYRHLVNDYLIINGELKVTSIHRLYVNNQWKTAGEILVGDDLTNKDSHLVKVFSIERVNGSQIPVYNLEVEKYKTYIAGNFYVHNQKGEGVNTTRKDFLDTAYWQPHLKTDQNGKAKVEIKLPDNLTTWRFAVMANSSQAAFGSAVSEVVVSRDLLIRPFLPRFLSIGDQSKLGAIVVNNSGEDQVLTVQIEAEGLAIKEAKVKKLSLVNGAQAKVTWLTLTQNTKSAKIKLKIESQNQSLKDALEMTLPINSYSIPETVATSGEAKDTALEKIILPKEIDLTQGKADISLSPTLGGASLQGFSYLYSYPYYCAEQIASRFIPAVYINRVLTKAKIKRSGLVETDLLNAVINDSLQRFNNSQKSDGGWGWWPENQSDPFITAYIYSGLTEAKKDGFSVPDLTLERSREFLVYQLNYNNPEISPNLRAYLLYVLRNEKINLNSHAANLFERRFELSYQSRAQLAIVLKNLPNKNGQAKRLLNELISLAKKTATTTHWEEPKRYSYFGSNTTTTAAVLEALISFDSKNPLISEVVRYLMTIRENGHWSTTLDTSWVIKAISTQLLSKKETNLDENYRLILNGQILKQDQFKKGDLLNLIEETIPINNFKIGQENQLKIEKSGSGSLYYNLNLNYYLPFSEIKPLEQGVVVVREFIDNEGKLLSKDSLFENSEVWVRLIIVTPQERHYLVIEDILPAGMEAINESLKNVSILNKDRPKVKEKGNQIFYFNHKEYHDDKTSIFTDYLPPGVYELTYRVRTTTPGRYHYPPAQAYQMYLPDISGHSDGGWLEIKSQP